VGLKPWQQIVIDEIESYEDFVNAESIQSISDFEINRLALIQISLRKGEGHTFMTAYLAKKYAATVIYYNIDHYKDMEIVGEIGRHGSGEAFHPSSEFVSVFEMRHDILLSTKNEWIAGKLNALKSKFSNKRLVVIDRGVSVTQQCPEIIDFICQTTQATPIVLLG
jgi:hypothetical protein|tara:strand:- start:10648 stop:11145 length:498 start_codon:yes stop_codon:yes gene_type:complete